MTARRGLYWLALAALFGPGCDKTLTFDPESSAEGGQPGTAGTAGTAWWAGTPGTAGLHGYAGHVGHAGEGEPWQRAGSPGKDPLPATGGTGFFGEENCESFCAAVGQRCYEDEQTCVECFWDQDCKDGLYCDRALNRCSTCNRDDGCPGDQWCDNGMCRETCVSEANPDRECQNETQVCDERRTVCISCWDDEDCAGSPDGPRCADDGARCAECASDIHCGGDLPHCDPLLFRCVECTDSRECEAPWLCHPEAHVCADPRLEWPFPT
jgi:hypothetical protein